MKKYELPMRFLAALSLWSGSLRAQSLLDRFEVEAGPTVIASAASLGGDFEPTWNFFADARYHFPSVPFDVGLRFGLGTLAREWPDRQTDATYRFKNLSAVADYNIRQGKNFSVFVGVGIGWTHRKDEFYPMANPVIRSGDGFFCMPRLGIECGRVVRLSAGWNLTGRAYRNAECSLGVVIGGWRKR